MMQPDTAFTVWNDPDRRTWLDVPQIWPVLDDPVWIVHSAAEGWQIPVLHAGLAGLPVRRPRESERRDDGCDKRAFNPTCMCHGHAPQTNVCLRRLYFCNANLSFHRLHYTTEGKR